MQLHSFWTRASFSSSPALPLGVFGLELSRLLLYARRVWLRLSRGSSYGTGLPSTTVRCATNRVCHLESTTQVLWEAFASSPTSSGAFSYLQNRSESARFFVLLLPSQ